jgi:3-oxoacyl-[acyl-carrier protein] reductase
VDAVSVSGLELAFDAPRGDWRFTGSGAVTRAEIEGYVAPDPLIPGSAARLLGLTPANVPEWQWTLGAERVRRIVFGELRARLDLNGVGRVNYTLDNVLYAPPRITLDGRAEGRFGRWTAAAWFRNLTDRALGHQRLRSIHAAAAPGPRAGRPVRHLHDQPGPGVRRDAGGAVLSLAAVDRPAMVWVGGRHMFSLDFTGRSVLVVGGSSGIGNGIAQAFRSHGAEVHVWGTRARAEDYAGEDGSDLEGLNYTGVDVADSAAVQAAATAPERLDVLVLSQGTVIYRRGEFEMGGFGRVLDVNLSSLMACALAFEDRLRAAKGSLITVSSTAAYHATKGNPAYAASKAGAVGLTRTLAAAWAPDIRVNGIAPGLVDTKLTRVTTQNPQRLAGSLAGIPLGRLGTPTDMAGAALFLASPMAAYVVGQTLPVDGGLLVR